MSVANDPPTLLCERYEGEICLILAVLGEIDEEYKYFRVNDTTSFRELHLSPEQLRVVSEKLGVGHILRKTLVIAVAEFLFQKDSSKEFRKSLDI